MGLHVYTCSLTHIYAQPHTYVRMRRCIRSCGRPLFRAAFLFAFVLFIASAGTAGVIHGSRAAKLLVAYLQHVYARKGAVGLRYTRDGEDEICQVCPVRTARYGVHIDGFQFVPAVHGLQSARMRHDDHPDVVYTSPCLKLGEHCLDALRFGFAVAALCFDEKIGVYHQIFQRMCAAHPVGTVQDVFGRGRYFVHIQMNHVGIQKVKIGRQLSVGISGGVGFAQHQAHQPGDVLVLVGNLKGKIAYKPVGLLHDAAGQVVQKIGLAAVGHAGYDDEPADVGGMEDAVGQRAVAHAVTVVVFAVEHTDDFIPSLRHGDDIGGVAYACSVDDTAHHFDAVLQHHVAYVLASAGQGDEEAAGVEVVRQPLGECAAGQVGITADHDVVHLFQPWEKRFEGFAQVACGSRRYADDISVAGFCQHQRVFFAFHHDDPRNGFFLHEQRIEAVDVVRGARRGG